MKNLLKFKNQIIAFVLFIVLGIAVNQGWITPDNSEDIRKVVEDVIQHHDSLNAVVDTLK